MKSYAPMLATALSTMLLFGCGQNPHDTGAGLVDTGSPAALRALVGTSSTNAVGASDTGEDLEDVLSCSCYTPNLLGTCTSFSFAEPSSQARSICEELEFACPSDRFAPESCPDAASVGACDVPLVAGRASSGLTYYGGHYTPATAEANCNNWDGRFTESP